jgi:diamine N-acetyltransferase
LIERVFWVKTARNVIKEVDLEFAIKRCQVGDGKRLSLLGKATFLETYAGNTEAGDLLAIVEAEHSAERNRFWLQSDFAKIWIAETIPGHSASGYALALVPSDGGFGVEIKRLYVLHLFQQKGIGASIDK